MDNKENPTSSTFVVIFPYPAALEQSRDEESAEHESLDLVSNAWQESKSHKDTQGELEPKAELQKVA